MELSPRARERLERIGSLTATEQQQLQREREVEAALSAYYLGAIDAEGLWQQVKALTATHGVEAVKQAQLRMLQTFRLQMADDDFEKRKSGLLALESLKKNGKHSAIELLLGSIVSLRRRYNEVKQQAYEQLRGQVEAQLNAAGDQARQILPHNGVRIHLVIHRRADEGRRGGGDEDRGQQIIGDARSHLADHIGRGRGNDDQLGEPCQGDVVDFKVPV